MELFEKLYDEHENVKVRFIGFTTEQTRYDFGIVYTNMFLESPLLSACKLAVQHSSIQKK